MFRFLLTAFTVTLAVPGLSAAPIPPDGGKGVVFPFPAKAPLVLSLNGHDTARERLSKMLAAALPKEGAQLVKMFDAEIEKLLQGRKLTDIRKGARIFLVLNDLTTLVQDDPAISVLVPVTSHKEFLGSFLTKEEAKTLDRGRDGVDVIKTTAFGGEEERPVYLVDLKDYTAVTIDKATADAYAAKYTAATSEQMGVEPAETFVKADLAVYVNMDAINDQFGDQIRGFKGLVDFALQQAQQQGAFGMLTKKQVEALKVMFKGLVQGIEDCRSVVGGIEFRPEGLFAKLQFRFAENTPSANFLAAEKAEPFTELAKLPAGLGQYTAMRFGKDLTAIYRDLSQEFATTDEDARGAELLEGHLKDLVAAGPGPEYSASAPPGATFSVTPYKDADKAAKALAKAYKAVAAGGRINSIVVKTAPRVGDDAEKHRGFTFASVNLNFDFEASTAGLPEPLRETTLEGYKRMVPEKAAMWIGSDGKVVVRVMAKDWEAAKKLVDQYLDGKTAVGGDAGYKRVREQLAADANLLMIAEVESMVNNLVNAMKPAADAIPGFPQLGNVKKPVGGPPAYLGFSLSFKGDTATVTGFVPVSSIGVAAGMLESIFKRVE